MTFARNVPKDNAVVSSFSPNCKRYAYHPPLMLSIIYMRISYNSAELTPMRQKGQDGDASDDSARHIAKEHQESKLWLPTSRNHAINTQPFAKTFLIHQ